MDDPRYFEVDEVDDFAADVITVGDGVPAISSLFRTIKSPLVVGTWTLHNGHNPVIFPMYRKPRWLTRWAARVFFELVWEDANGKA